MIQEKHYFDTHRILYYTPQYVSFLRLTLDNYISWYVKMYWINAYVFISDWRYISLNRPLSNISHRLLIMNNPIISNAFHAFLILLQTFFICLMSFLRFHLLVAYFYFFQILLNLSGSTGSDYLDSIEYWVLQCNRP